MPLGFGSPYRAPCAGWSSPLVVSLGPENQHCNPGDNGKPIWQNLTVLFDSSAPTGNPSAMPTLHACSGGQTLIGDNCYQVQSPAAYKNFSTCHKYGFKNLVGAKYWHGRLGFAGGDCGGSYASTPNGTRYRTKAMVGTSESGTRVLLVFTPLTTASTGRTYTVARYTGLVAETSKVDVGYTGSGFNSAQKAAQFDYQCGSWVDTGGLGSGIVDVLNGTPDASVIVNSQSVSGTVASFDVTVLATGAYNRYTATITLSDAYTSGDWNGDVDALFAQWDLSDDAVYPWRGGGNCHLAPLLSYDEVAGYDVNQFTLPADTWVDVHTGRYGTAPTGGVIGLPLGAGYDKYWDSTAETWAIDSISGLWTRQGYGEYAPDWCPRATQWMNNNQGRWTSAGAWGQCNATFGGSLPGNPWNGRYVKCVWAETIMFAKPSHNFARPCGAADAAVLNQTTATCSGGVLTGSARFSGVPVPCPAPTASGYEWNDTGKKGDFIWKEWQFNFRDVTITPTLRPTTGPLTAAVFSQACVNWVPCCPAVAYIAPAGVSYGFTNAVKYTMPALGLDENCSALWQARPEQWMVDPLWQVPSAACTAQTLDDGTGTVGTYFPPYEECRLAVPSGAPAYPSGCGINYTNYVSNRNGGGDAIPECESPQPGTCEYPRWLTWGNQIAGCTWDIPATDCAGYTP